MTMVQRRLASLGILLGLGAGASGLVVWQQQRGAAHESRTAAAQKLFTVASPDEVQHVTLTTPNGTFTLEHTGTDESSWSLQSPMHTLAEASTVDAMVRAAIDLQITGRVGGKGPKDDMTQPAAMPADSTIFGLNPAAYALTLATRSGLQETLEVGKKNSYDGNLYVKMRGRSEIGMVAGTLTYQLDQDLYKLREKRPFIAATPDIVRLQVRPSGGTPYALERRDTGFVLTAPLQVAADATQVEALLGALMGLRAKTFAAEQAETPQSRSRFGLDKPTYQVILGRRGGADLTLRFGQLTLGTTPHYFVLREDIPSPVLELGSDWVFKKLGMTVAELRDMHVTQFDRDAVAGVHVKREGPQGGEIRLSKSHDAKAGTDSWTITEPARAAAQSSKAVALIYKIGNLRADSVAVEQPAPGQLKAAGLTPPSLVVELTDAAGAVLASVHIGQDVGEHSLVTNQSHSRIDRVAKSAIADISIQSSDYQEAATAKSN